MNVKRNMFEKQVVQITSKIFKIPCVIQFREIKFRTYNQQFVLVGHVNVLIRVLHYHRA